MSLNFIHHEIDRIRKERTRIFNKLELMPEEAPMTELLNQRYFDFTDQQNKLESLVEFNRGHFQ